MSEKQCRNCVEWEESWSDEEIGLCQMDCDFTFYDEVCGRFKDKED